jgi:hypothetical protein
MSKNQSGVEWLVNEIRLGNPLNDETVELAKRKENERMLIFCTAWYFANLKCTAPITPEDYLEELMNSNQSPTNL